jgi:hypothetical protein
VALPADEDQVFVPARPVAGVAGVEPAVELRRQAYDGELVGLAFSTPRLLADTLGPHQPWIGVPMGVYVALLRLRGVERVQVDPVYAGLVT